MKAATHTIPESTPSCLCPAAEATVAEPTTTTPDVSRFGTACAFLRNGTCSKTLMTVMNRELGHPLRAEERAADPLAGGLMRGYQCGMLWGSSLAAGAQAHRMFGAGPLAETAALRAAGSLTEAFEACNHHTDCMDLTETDPQDGWQTFVHFFVKGGTFTCIRRAADFAPHALRSINQALAEKGEELSCRPENCAVRVARLMGASELHTSMVAGLAGGLGLSGGACGALGAAIWLVGLQGQEEGATNKTIMHRIEQLIERFLKTSDHEFECSEITGRQFATIDEHSHHVRAGGCSEIIETLAAPLDH